MLEEIKILHETEKSRIILLRDSETKKKVIRKELRGNHSLYVMKNLRNISIHICQKFIP